MFALIILGASNINHNMAWAKISASGPWNSWCMQHTFPWSSFEQHLHCFLSPWKFHASPSLGIFPLFVQFDTLIEEVLECFLSPQSGQRLVWAECRLATLPTTQECPPEDWSVQAAWPFRFCLCTLNGMCCQACPIALAMLAATWAGVNLPRWNFAL